ncbi:MAG TPA: hypothetical protein VFU37_02300, partial [Pyrinomonadaceae bacterium]|nr:hypothetical protein [Pyrinomonadaceae bacterium]
ASGCSLGCGYSLNSCACLAACNALDVRRRTKRKFGGNYEQTQTTNAMAQHTTRIAIRSIFLPASGQGQNLDSLTAVAKGHGVIANAVEERKFTTALAVLRQDGTVLITLYSDLLLQAQGTWSASTSSPEEILLKITGGEVSGNATGTGKLLLSNDRKFIKELTIKGKFFDGREIVVTFVADAPEDQKEYEPGFISVGTGCMLFLGLVRAGDLR